MGAIYLHGGGRTSIKLYSFTAKTIFSILLIYLGFFWWKLFRCVLSVLCWLISVKKKEGNFPPQKKSPKIYYNTVRKYLK